MSIITFWSKGREQTGKSLSVAAVATNLAIQHNLKILIISTGYKDEILKKCFCEEKKIKNLGVFGPNTNVDLSNGIQGLIKIMRSNKISPDIIPDYTKVILKDRLEILLPYAGNPNEYREMLKDYIGIINLANKYYDLILIDLEKNIEIEKEIFEVSDVIVASISQRLSTINEFIEEREANQYLNGTKVIPVIGRYDKFSKYTSKNISRFLNSKNEMSSIPYNTLFFEACEETKLVDFFLKMRNLTDAEDRNVFFIKEVEKVSDKIMAKVEETKRMKNR